jgi:MFS family permease
VVVGCSHAFALFFMTELWHIFIVATLNGLGVGLGYAAMPTLIMRAVPAEETAAANGLNALARYLGTTSAAAVIGTILASVAVASDGISIPTASGFQLAFGTAALAALVAAAIALTVPGTPQVPGEHRAMPDPDGLRTASADPA